MLPMQQPTCTNVRIRSTEDAHKIFYAVQKGILKMVTRRLDADERLALKSGCLYVWEERAANTEITGLGIERFTEGRRWSPSRVRDEFLFYYEKYSPPQESGQSRGSPINDKQQPPRDWDALVKQTYSVWVETDKGRRKWHLTAYFTQETVDQLGTVDDLPEVSRIVVPEGTFKSTRVIKNRSKTDESSRSADDKANSRTFAPFPSPIVPYVEKQQAPVSSSSVRMYEPYPVLLTDGSYGKDGNQVQQQYPPEVPLMPGRHHSPPRGPYYERAQPMPKMPAEPRSSLSGAITPIAPSNDSQQHMSPIAVSPMHQPHPGYYPNQYPQSGMSYSPAPQWFPNQGVPHPPEPPSSQHQLTGYPTPPRYDYPLQGQFSPQPNNGMVSPYQNYVPPYSYRPSPDPFSPASSYLPPLSIPDTTPNSLSSAISPQAMSATMMYAHHNDGTVSPSESSSSDGTRRGEVGPRRNLAPLHSLERMHPYHRDPVDDKTLRRLDPRPLPAAAAAAP